MTEPTRRRARHDIPEETGGGGVDAPEQWSPELAAAWLPAPAANDDKYRRGVLGVRTGSAAYPGAAVLSVSAAWRTGLGMLRYVPALDDSEPRFGLPSPAAAVLSAHPETVFGAGGCDAWLIGSGRDEEARSDEERAAILDTLAGQDPVVVDAGAIGLVLERGAPGSPAIVTPHQGEFARLWQASGLGARPAGWPARDRTRRSRIPKTEARAAAATRLAERIGATVLLKGSVSITATPGGQVYLSGPATPWLATAGTGDVLAGILGALATAHADAIREDPEVLGAIGATAASLHDAAARIASGDTVSAPKQTTGQIALGPAGSPVVAGDVARAIPQAAEALRSLRRGPSRRRRGSPVTGAADRS